MKEQSPELWTDVVKVAFTYDHWYRRERKMNYRTKIQELV